MVNDVTIDPSIANELPAEALAALRKSKGAATPKAKPAEPAQPTAEAEITPTVEPVSTDTTITADAVVQEDEFTIDLGAEPEQASPENVDGEEDHSISDEQLDALPKDFRDKYRAKDRENLKLRKRAQEVEGKLKEAEEAKAKLEQEVTAVRSTSSGLEGNVFQQFAATDTAKVAEWVSAADAINAKIQRINFLQAKGAEVPEDMFRITLPNGKEAEIDETLVESSAQWEKHARAWSQHQKVSAEDQTTAAQLSARLSKYDGYQKSYEALKAKPPGRETLLTKAALYDFIVAQGAKITFQGKAASAQKDAVPGRTPAKAIPTSPRGAVPSTPSGGGSSHSAERARLMKLAANGDEAALEAALLLPKD